LKTIKNLEIMKTSEILKWYEKQKKLNLSERQIIVKFNKLTKPSKV
jgi:hypothetical protein